MWIALHGDRLVARAAWWSRAERARPARARRLRHRRRRRRPAVASRSELRLLETALADVISRRRPPTGLHPFRPTGLARRRNGSAGRQGSHRGARAGWCATAGRTPAPRMATRNAAARPERRLAFRPVGDRAELVALMTLVLDGHTRRPQPRSAQPKPARAKSPPNSTTTNSLAYSSPHDWWRIATLSNGEPVGFVIPAHNGYNPIIAYIGVLPRHRGRGLRRRHPRRRHPYPRREQRPTHTREHRSRQRPDGQRVRTIRLRVFQRQIDMTWDGEL